LQHQRGGGTWVLKCPDHVFALAAVRAVYPDARFVFLHRDPVEVLSSVAKLTEVLRRPFTRHVDRHEIGRQVSERWARGATILVEENDAASTQSERILHMRFRNLVEDPFGSVAALYERFGLRFSHELATAVRGFVAERPNGGYGRIHSRLADYGLDARVERLRYRDYIGLFGV